MCYRPSDTRRFCSDTAFRALRCVDVDGCEWLDDAFVLCSLVLQPHVTLCGLRAEAGVSEPCMQFYHAFHAVLCQSQSQPLMSPAVVARVSEISSVRSFLGTLGG